MNQYWNDRFKVEGMIWGSEPSPTALHARDIFKQQQVQSVLVPGSGYGRNTKALSAHFKVDAVELSSEAATIARQWDSASFVIEETVLEMNLGKQYDGIYCYDLLHLFLSQDRDQLIQRCKQHLRNGGYMYFTSFSDEDPHCGVGKNLEAGTYEYKEGKFAHFFSDKDLRDLFNGLHIIETGTVVEILTNMNQESHQYLLRYIVVMKEE
jgi:SAM-dependent methyltransferase